MKIYTNHKRLQQKQRIGTVASMVGFGIMLIALFVSWQQPDYLMIAWTGMFVGLAVAMFGTYHVNRWVRPPLAHKVLAESLDELGRRYMLFNYVGLIPHLLLTPKGLIAIKAKKYEGPASYDSENERWLGKFSLWKLYTTGLTAEGLGDPSEEVTQLRNEVLAWLQVNVPDLVDDIPVAGIALFTAPKTELTLPEKLPVPVVQPDGLKESVKKQFKMENRLRKTTYKQLSELLIEQAKEAGASEDEKE